MRDAWLDLVHGATCVCCGRPGRLLCPDCEASLPRGAHPARPTPCPDGLAPGFAAGEYADPLRPLILAHKEHRAFGLARPLGALLAGVVEGVLTGVVDGPAERVLLVPVPSRPAVVRVRGHDPLLRIVRAAAARLRGRHDVRVGALLRQRDRPEDQSGLDSTQRTANLVGTLAARPERVRAVARAGVPVSVVLCDDVLTTGATAREGQRALEAVGIRVGAIACVAATRKRVLPLSPTGR